MRARGIPMTAPMALATLREFNPKRQTRRAMQKQPPAGTREFCTYHHPDPSTHHWAFDGEALMDFALPCPYGEVGDRLWVREAWRVSPEFDAIPPREIPPETFVLYDADGQRVDGDGRYRPAMFMPRWASRIELEITGVRAERLGDISEADALAEGLTGWAKDGRLVKYGIPDRDGQPGTDDHGWPWQEWSQRPQDAFLNLINRIHGDEGPTLSTWMWVIEFQRVSP